MHLLFYEPHQPQLPGEAGKERGDCVAIFSLADSLIEVENSSFRELFFSNGYRTATI